MTLSEISIRKPVFAWMLMFCFFLCGGIGLKRLGISQLPDVDFPTVSINVTLDGATPEVIESLLIEPIEDAVMSIQGIEGVSSSARTGRANINVDFKISKNIDTAVQEVQTVLAQVQRRLPEEADVPTVSKSNPEDQPILWFGIGSSKMTTPELMAFVRDHVKDKFTTVEGVSEVFLGGYIDPNLRVWVSADKLKQYSLTVADVIGTIKKEHTELPAGRIESGDKETNIRLYGEATTPEDLGKLPMNFRGGAPNYSPVPLSAVARIEDGLADARRLSRAMGKPSIGIGIKKQRGANTVAVGHAAKARMEELKKTLPPDMEAGINFDSTKFIEESVDELKFTLLLSAILTSLVCWLFLGSWSATMNVILAIPISIVGSFFCLYLLGFTLNSFTLLALSLAIGIVVDDAIMVLEHIVAIREKGKSRRDAALIGSREITFAAVAATAAIIAIFLPIAFVEGVIGRYLYQFGVTLSVAVFLSLIEALSFAPMRCAGFLEVGERTTRLGKAMDGFFHLLERGYARMLPWILNHRVLALALSLLFFIGSLFGFKFLRTEFIPSQDQGQLMIRVQTPLGSSLAFTDKKFQEIEKLISAWPEIDRYFASVGGMGGGDVNTGVIFVTLKEIADRPLNPDTKKPVSQNEVGERVRALRSQLTDTTIFVQDLSMSGFSRGRGFPIQFTLKGPDWKKLAELNDIIKKKMEDSGLLLDVDSNYKEGMPLIEVIPDRAKALARGVSITEIQQAINSLVGGIAAGQFSRNGKRYDIRVRLEEVDRDDPSDLEKILIRNNRGELISLGEVVTIRKGTDLQGIFHEDRERAITITGSMAKGVSQDAANKAIEGIAKEVLPEGYSTSLGGSSAAFRDASQGLLFALILGLAVAYMILGAQFNSFIHPMTVLIALPFSISGAIIGLLLTGQSVNLFSMIGIILLMGIVKKNSILLVDFTNQSRHRGKNVREAILEACPSRMRAILMTSLSTIAGAIPPALAFGPGAEIHRPMAVSVIGGVFISTLLTLFVVPSLYSLFSKWERTRYGEPEGA